MKNVAITFEMFTIIDQLIGGDEYMEGILTYTIDLKPYTVDVKLPVGSKWNQTDCFEFGSINGLQRNWFCENAYHYCKAQLEGSIKGIQYSIGTRLSKCVFEGSIGPFFVKKPPSTPRGGW